jgi:multiple sugar transport system permease protein/sn-glycerol 3-phosphate transport system permease protein
MQLSRSWAFFGHFLCVTLCLSVLLPMLMVVGTSLKPPGEVYSANPFPLDPTLQNYAEVLGGSEYLRFFANSVINAVVRVGGQLVICLLAAYAFARFEFPGREPIFYLVLGAMMIPPQLTMIPNYMLMANLDWFDTFAGLIIPNLAAPLGVFLLRQHMLAFPRELLDAAEIDGAGQWGALWRIIVPNLRPALAALAIILSIECWNEYFWPLLVTQTSATQTIQIGLRRFLQEEMGDRFGPLMAAVTLSSLPALIVFMLFQRHVLTSFLSSGLKG